MRYYYHHIILPKASPNMNLLGSICHHRTSPFSSKQALHPGSGYWWGSLEEGGEHL